jgi:hypothetical protein
VFLWALFVQVALPTPLAIRGLLALCQDMAELLALLTLCQVILGSVCFHLVIEVTYFEYLSVLGTVTKNNGTFTT